MATAGSLFVSMPTHGAADHLPASTGSAPLVGGVNAAHSSSGSAASLQRRRVLLPGQPPPTATSFVHQLPQGPMPTCAYSTLT
eukprot:scaffold45531_cov63-Phaeocystis_antarctica.AAC.4